MLIIIVTCIFKMLAFRSFLTDLIKRKRKVKSSIHYIKIYKFNELLLKINMSVFDSVATFF